MQHRFVIVTGSSLGAGKTTFSALLAERLRASQLPVRWLQEENFEAILRPFIPHWAANNLTPGELLGACRGFVERYRSDQHYLIADSVLPGYIELFGRYPLPALEQFSAELYTVLEPLQPVVVYLQADIDMAFERAIAQRGAQWMENIRGYLNSWQLPLYSARPKPFQTAADVRDYFRALDAASRQLLDRWPGRVVRADTTHVPIDEAFAALLSACELPQAPPAPGASAWSTGWEAYLGTYRCQQADAHPAELSILQREGRLFIDTYWPIGTELVPIDADTFRLSATDRRVYFQRDRDQRIAGLQYTYLGQTYSYRRQED